MYILLAFLLLFFPLFLHVPSKDNKSLPIMSMEYTTVLRAVAILMVMLQHLSGFIFGSRVFTPFGGGGVAVFLIVSGFGLTVSARHRGINDFWMKKNVRVFVPWMLVWILVTLLNVDEFQFKTIKTLFTPNWYLQYLFVCYVFFYVSYKWAYQYRWFLFVAFAMMTFFLGGNIQAEQCCSFQLGVLLAERDSILICIKKNISTLLFIGLSLFVIVLGIKQMDVVRLFIDNNYIAEHFLNFVLKASLAVFVMTACGKWFKYINSWYAEIVGKMSYELYLVHLSLVIGICNAIETNPITKIIIFVAISFSVSGILYLVDHKILKVYSKFIEK